jgi:hypothetical protein
VEDEAARRQSRLLLRQVGEHVHWRLEAEEPVEGVRQARGDGLLEERLGEAPLPYVAPLDRRLRAAPVQPDRKPPVKIDWCRCQRTAFAPLAAARAQRRADLPARKMQAALRAELLHEGLKRLQVRRVPELLA